MVDSCETQPVSRGEALSYFWHNFNRFYRGNRAPFGVHLHPDWLQKNDGEYMDAFGSFLDSLLDMNDVYFVTAHQVFIRVGTSDHFCWYRRKSKRINLQIKNVKIQLIFNLIVKQL